MNKHFPSIKTLCNSLKIDDSQAKEIRATWKQLRNSWSNRLIDDAMIKIDKILDTHGVEAIVIGEFERLCIDDYWKDKFWGGAALLYCNNGHTYQPTIAYDTTRERFLIISWGGWYERNVIYEGPE